MASNLRYRVRIPGYQGVYDKVHQNPHKVVSCLMQNGSAVSVKKVRVSFAYDEFSDLHAEEYFDEVKALIWSWVERSQVRNKTGWRSNAVRNIVKNVNWERGLVTFTTTVVLTSKLTNSNGIRNLVASGDFEQVAFAKADEKVLQKMFAEKFKSQSHMADIGLGHISLDVSVVEMPQYSF